MLTTPQILSKPSSHLCLSLHFFLLNLFLTFNFPLLFRHNQRSLEVQKDPDHKNRCRVRFPEVFSSFPYTVNVTAVNALGKASNTISFEESSIGKIDAILIDFMLWLWLHVYNEIGYVTNIHGELLIFTLL